MKRTLSPFIADTLKQHPVSKCIKLLTERLPITTPDDIFVRITRNVCV